MDDREKTIRQDQNKENKHRDQMNRIQQMMQKGGILDVMTALQKDEGYLSREAMEDIAKAYGITTSQVYDTASFYAMIRLQKPGKTDILVCKSAPCHVAGAGKVVEAIEKHLGIRAGETTEDGKYSFSYCPCMGQCQSSPSVLINGELYTEMTPEKIIELIDKGGAE